MKYLYIAVLSAVLAGCSVNQISRRKLPESNPNIISTSYYTLGETAYQNNDFEAAINLFKRASLSDGGSIHIKERLLETMAISSYYKAEYLKELIELGEMFYAEGLYSVKMLLILADACRLDQNYEKAEQYYSLALEMQPTMHNLALYYVFRKEFYPPADTTLLDKAIALPWKNRDDVIRLAILFNDFDPERSLEILLDVYEKWDDEQSLKSLLTAFEKAGKQDDILRVIQERVNEDKDVSEGLIIFLISKYFSLWQFEKIVENRDVIFKTENEEILRFLFFSTINLDEYELGIKAGLAIEELDGVPPNLKSSFYTYLIKLFIDNGDLEKAVEYLVKSNDNTLVREMLFQYDYRNDVESREKLFVILRNYASASGETDVVNYLFSIIHTQLENRQQAIQLLESVSEKYLIENELTSLAAAIYLRNVPDLTKARYLIELAPDSVYTSNEILSSLLYGSGHDSLALTVCLLEFDENPVPHVSTYLRFSILADKLDSRQNMLPIMIKGLELYPENADLMNALGYMIAKFEMKDYYDLAYKLLHEIVELEPDNEMFWDSLAWLYFVDGNPKKALQTMEIPLSKEIRHSEIAYHLGAIYLELGHEDFARQFLELAVEIDDDEQSVKISRELLEKL